MIDAAGQREEALQVIGDVAFDLLRRHTRIKRRHNHYRHVHRREHIDRHASDAAHAEHKDHEADNDNQVRGADGKAGHAAPF